MKKLFATQTGILFAGSVFAFFTVIQDFLRFYNYEGTIFKIKGCVVPNPVTTPCFYGAFAFLLAFLWSYNILSELVDVKIWQKRLNTLLIAGTIFAWSNFSYTLYKFFEAQKKGNPFTGCSGVSASNPWVTPCFIGAVIFLISLILGLLINRKLTKTPQL